MGQWKYRFEKPEPKEIRGVCVQCNKNPQKREKNGYRPLCSQCCKRLYTGSANSGRYRKEAIVSNDPVADYESKGRANKAVRRRLVEKIGGEFCQTCGYDKVPGVLHVHHIIERCNGGTNTLGNLELLCPTCHEEEHYNRRVLRGSVAESG